MRGRSLLPVAVLILLCGCEASHVTDSWHDPSFIGQIKFKRTLVLAMTPDVKAGRTLEDEMVKRLGEPRSVQGYRLTTEEDRADSEHLKPRVQTNGVDGVIIMRQVGTQAEGTWLPGSGEYPYDPLWSFYDHARAAEADQAMRKDLNVRLQTNIYRVRDGKLIWTGLSDGFLAPDLPRLAENLCRSVEKQLKKEDMLQ